MALDRLATLAIDVIVNAGRANRQMATTAYHMERLHNQGRRMESFFNSVGILAGIGTLVRSIQLFVEVMKKANEEAAKLQKQIGDVDKIAGLGFEKSADAFFKLESANPTATFEQISEAMQEAARAGNDTAESINAVAQSGIRLATTSGDITSGRATKQLARFSKNFDIANNKVDNLASAIDILSDKFPTSSGEILTASTRMTGFAEQVGISIEELIAFTAVLNSAGASSTTLRTTLTKTLLAITGDTLKVAESLNLAGDDIERFGRLASTSPFDAMREFFVRLSGMSIAEQTAALKELGLNSSRVRQVIDLAKSSIDKLDAALKTAKQEFADGTALINKYNKEVDLTATAVTKLNKEWTLFIGSMGDSSFLRNLTRVVQGMRDISEYFGGGIKKPSALGSFTDLTSVTKEIKSVLKQLDEATLERQKNKDALKNPFNFVGDQVLGGLAFTKSLNDAQRKIEILTNKFERLRELKKQMLEQPVVDDSDKKAAADLKVAEMQTKLEERRAKARKVLVNQLMTARGRNDEQAIMHGFNKFREAVQEAKLPFAEANELIQERLKIANDKLAKAATKAATALENEFARNLNSAIKLTGDFSRVLSVITDHQANVQKFQKVAPGFDFNKFLSLQLGNLAKTKAPKTQFRSLTQAWRDSMKNVDKKDDQFRKMQLELAKQLLANMTATKDIQAQALDALESIDEKAGLEIK